MSVTKVLLLVSFTFLWCLQPATPMKDWTYENYSKRENSTAIGNPGRLERSLLFFDPSYLILIFGLGTPLQLDVESVIIGAFIKFQYCMPNNASDYTMPGVEFNRQNGKSRWNVYKVVEKIAGIYGFGGKACMLRAICEAAYAPFDSQRSLLGQLLQVFLKPSTTNEAYEEHGNQEYHAAEEIGRQLEESQCHSIYPECPKSLLDVFSTVVT